MNAPPATAQLRCWQCKRLLAEVVTAPWKIICARCKAINAKGLDTGPPPGLR